MHIQTAASGSSAGSCRPHTRNICIKVNSVESYCSPSFAAIDFRTMQVSKSAVRLHFICSFFALASFQWGFVVNPQTRWSNSESNIVFYSYNIGILATIYVHPGFKIALHYPTPSQTGLITAIYYLGTWTSYLFVSHPASDRFGRRYAALSGVLVTCVGAALQAGATGSGALAMMIVGRIICGFGLAVVSTSVPLYQRFAQTYQDLTAFA